jgi:putative addiction module component (TIGR02574 family)
MPIINRSDLLQLSVADRLELIEDLWDSIPASELSLTPQQCQELDRRLDEMERCPDDEISWEDLKARLLSR